MSFLSYFCFTQELDMKKRKSKGNDDIEIKMLQENMFQAKQLKITASLLVIIKSFLLLTKIKATTVLTFY